MIRSSLVLGVLALIPGTAWAQTGTYNVSLPETVEGMELINSETSENGLLAHYDGNAGRATVRIGGAPASEPGGASVEDRTPSGKTPLAQRALLQLLDRNLSEGTNALGANYETAPIQAADIEVDGVDLGCAFIERFQAADAVGPGKGRMKLIDRICTVQDGEAVLSVYITTPVSGDEMEQAMTERQVVFSGVLLNTLVRQAAE